MKGSEFAASYGPQGARAWELAALDMAQNGGVVTWPMKPVTFTCAGQQVTTEVSSDYFAVGTPSDFLRLPLTPLTAQAIANLSGLLLPTPKLVLETWRAANVKLEPIPATKLSAGKNLYANMSQFVEHNARVNAQLEGTPNGALRSGHKKDVVIGNIYKPGKVLIYGWMKPDAPLSGKDTFPSATAPWRIQPYSNIHGESYFDYSHGIRFVGPQVSIDGVLHDTEKVLTDSKLAHLLSDEGPLKAARLPAPGAPKPSFIASLFRRTFPGYAHYGLQALRNGEVT